MSTYQNLGDQEISPEDRVQWEFTNQSYKKEKDRKDIGKYIYDDELSNYETAVWHNHSDKKTQVAHRGSKSAYDWFVSDFQVAGGLENSGKRFKNAEQETIDAHNKFNYSTDVSGHSLGGSITSNITKNLGNSDWFNSGTTFNSGVSSIGKGSFFSSSRSECSKPNPPAYCNKITHLKEKGDLLSNRNIACDKLTWGLFPSACTKTDPFGTTKYYEHKKGKRARDHFTGTLGWVMQRARPHSLQNFVNN
jgi:hypothetical protein